MMPELRLGDAVAALILVEGDGYLMQLRDKRPDIWYPGHWGLFGGAVDAGEDPRTALARELREELELEVTAPEFFARFNFDLGGAGLPSYYRNYYVVSLNRADPLRLVLHEGAAMRVFSGAEILQEAHVTPYDAFAIYLHYERRRLA